MNKRQRKKFEKKGYHRKCLGPDEIVFLGIRLKKVGQIRPVCSKSEITPMTPDQIRGLGVNLTLNAFKDGNYNKFLNEACDSDEQTSEEEIRKEE